MNRKIIFAAAIGLAMFGAPAKSATTSAQLEALAKQAEQSQYNALLNYQIWAALREPAKTLDGVTLTTIGSYTRSIDAALTLQPANWYANVAAHPAPVSPKATCTALLDFWDPTPSASLPNGYGLRTEVWSAGLGNCASVLTAAELRAWAWKLKTIGR